MTLLTVGSGLSVDVAVWPDCAIPRSELSATMAFLAHKAGKSVRCLPYRGHVQYSPDVIHVYVPTNETEYHPVSLSSVKLRGTVHPLHADQTGMPEKDALGSEIRDDEGRPLARVDHNCIVVKIDVAAQDNEAGKAILAYVVEAALPLFDFEIAELVEKQKGQISKRYLEFHKAALRSRLDDRTREVQRLEREVEDLYYRLVNAQRELPMLKQEAELLEKLIAKKAPEAVEKQASALLALVTNGQYEEILPETDGTLRARTSPIIIEYDNWVFQLGRYNIHIDSTGKVSIYSEDGADGDGYPHPHVDSSGRPCLGNIAPDLAKAIGSMRTAEALVLLHDFLSSYNPEAPYVRIGKFDPEYDDPDEDTCEDCSDYATPFCVCECSRNDGMYSCGDCGEYRTEYCYTECSYNVPGFQFVSPCDDCEDTEEHCFLKCQHNTDWQQRNPCEVCEDKDCDECAYAGKKQSLEARNAPASSPSRTR